MKTRSVFQKWFEAQHGKRPNTGGVTDEKLREYVSLGDSAGREMYARKIYDAKQQAALLAWSVNHKACGVIKKHITRYNKNRLTGRVSRGKLPASKDRTNQLKEQ